MRTDNAIRHFIRRPHSFLLIGVFLFAAAVLAVPFYSANSSSLAASKQIYAFSEAQANRTPIDRLSTSNPAKVRWGLGLRSVLRIAQPLTETIDTYAADCTTPRTTFYAGET